MSLSKTTCRGCRAVSSIELAIGVLVLLPIALMIFDLCTIVLAVQVNNAACREAARVAASGSPADAQARAQAVVDHATTTAGGLVSKITLVSITNTISPQNLAQSTNYGGPLQGTMTVQTDVDVKPFIVQWVYSGGKPLHFRSTQTFPITYIVPSP